MIPRCDRCSQVAKEVWELSAQQMFFCGHHANEHRAALHQKGWVNMEVVE